MKFKLLIFMVCSSFLLSNCIEDKKEPLVKSNEIPAAPTNVKVENIAGGAKISYTLPDDPHLLYVQAVYIPKGNEKRIVKSSIFKNFVLLEGFGESMEYQVTLNAVNRYENISEPVTVTIFPLKAPILFFFESLKTIPTFGGVKLTFENESGNEYSVYTLVKDSITGEWIEYDRMYTSAKVVNYSIRGFNPVPTDFAFFVRDKWKNSSDTIFTVLTPLFEVEFDKSLWSDAALIDDSNMPRYGPLSQLWTPGATTYFFMKQDMPGLKLPNWFTIDLGRPYIFGRMHLDLVNHHNNWKYAQGTPKKFEIWGSNVKSTDWNNWTLLGEFELIKPSGLPVGQLSQADQDAAASGHDFDFNVLESGFRYMRFKTLSTYGGNPDVYLREITLFGKPVE